MNYAGFWLRFVAAIIDGIIFMVIGSALSPISNIVALNITGLLISWLYFTLLESSEWQGTVGKKLLNLKVTDESGNKIDFRSANIRYWSKILSGIIFCIGYIMAGFTVRKQALHDLIARTLVIKK